MHRYEAALLKSISKGRWESLDDAMSASGLARSEILWAIENLQARSAIEVRRHEAEKVELTPEGERYAKSGMPEEQLLSRAKVGRIGISSLKSKEEQIGFQWAKKKGLVSISKGNVELTPEGEKARAAGVEEGNILRKIAESPESYFALMESRKDEVYNLLKRGLITIKKRSEIGGIRITEKGRKEMESSSGEEQTDALSKAVIANKSWKGKEFKPYEVSVDVEREPIAMRHPIRNTIRKVMQTYLSLGFRQVSGPIIEPAFWVFDALFMPQDHPAREIQDAFYLSEPKRLDVKEKGHVEAVRKAHLESWGGEWSEETASQAMLRTQNTSISARHIQEALSEMKSGGANRMPLKLFSVGRVFRNENIDYKHLTDFYQTDGIIIGNNLTMANLFDTLISIYSAFGMDVKFKPAYFPFVEPGAEVYAYYGKTKEWIEMGGSGIMRREVTGVPRKNITVLAWGLGIERLAMLADPSIKSVTELYNNDVGWLRKRRMM